MITLFNNSADAVFYPMGTILFREGEVGQQAYVVVEGELEIVFKGKVLATVGPGGIAGELALIDASPRSADCRAKTNVRVVSIDQRRFTFLIQQTPFFAIQVMKVMAERLRTTNQMVVPAGK